MISMRVVLRVIQILMTVRVTYAVGLFYAMLFSRFGWSELAPDGSFIGEIVHNMDWQSFLTWFVYVHAYALATFLVWRSHVLSIWIYTGAYAVDLASWVWIALSPTYSIALNGMAPLIDGVFNVFDLLMIAMLGFLRLRGQLGGR